MERGRRALELAVELMAARGRAVARKSREGLLDVTFGCLCKLFLRGVGNRCSSDRARHPSEPAGWPVGGQSHAGGRTAGRNRGIVPVLPMIAVSRRSPVAALVLLLEAVSLAACGSASDSGPAHAGAGLGGSSAGVAGEPQASAGASSGAGSGGVAGGSGSNGRSGGSGVSG